MRVILLPGLDGTGLLFSPLLENLPGDIKTEIISYPWNDNQSYLQLEEYVRMRLPEDEEFIFIAESFSGVIAYNIAKSAPSNLKSIIFVASFLKPPLKNLYLLNTLPLSWLLKLHIPEFAARRYLLGNNIENGMVNYFGEVIRKIPGKVLARRLREVSNLRCVLKKISIPCIYIQAEDDKLVPSDNLKLFRKAIPDINVILVSGPHLILQANPVVCAKVIAEEYRLLASH